MYVRMHAFMIIYEYILYVDMDACGFSHKHAGFHVSTHMNVCMSACIHVCNPHVCIYAWMSITCYVIIRVCMTCPTEDVLYPQFRTADKSFAVCPTVNMNHFKRSSQLCLKRTNNTCTTHIRTTWNHRPTNKPLIHRPCNNQPPMVIQD